MWCLRNGSCGWCVTSRSDHSSSHTGGLVSPTDRPTISAMRASRIDQYLSSATWLTPAQCSGCLRHGYLFELTGAKGSKGNRGKGKGTETEKTKDREEMSKGPGYFTHIRHTMYTFTYYVCKGWLTKRFERISCHPATNVWSNSVLLFSLPVVALSL